ncbi:PilZ domain-containing protein [Aurantiacibacter aquimixticola]|uniref:PilZ domain-containing protein n=1 Tax=Aurantiacibacter aquimixticola TaxID=1958945 RepID=A0A419RUE0_9SPHN|nr:PilZ domain-containing protein [Aurantiacibacter aquimixticola]RJY09390.1 PilZ domain-containing protein [Aurantiacibacter aquimixticola]
MMMDNGARPVSGTQPEKRAVSTRANVDIDCDIRIAGRAWRKARIADLTPQGFQVTVLDMPARGTPVQMRFAGLQMLQAEVAWAKSDVAGCRFAVPLGDYVFDHIVGSAD